MKISEISIGDVINYLRLNEDEVDKVHLQAAMQAAKSYISSYTGIPAKGTGETPDGRETLDDHEDFYIAFMVLCQDAYDNRIYAAENMNANRVVTSILDLHARNLL